MASTDLTWYWHRFRAMSPVEMALHFRRRVRQAADARTVQAAMATGETVPGAFPRVPQSETAPESLRGAVRLEADAILSGSWRAFGHLDLSVDDPPRWQHDYLAGHDLETAASAFSLDHRALPAGADIKVVWELSRWHHLVRLAMAAHLFQDRRALEKTLDWLDDWVTHNPPYRGWNWTSALEAGIRLIQFAWIDALLSAAPDPDGRVGRRLAGLRDGLLAPHVRFAWRHRSFGSSANNHLLGELAGCLVATARWPALASAGAPLERLQALWEREVLAQFAGDGGNREQALNYQLFSLELCYQALGALEGAGRPVAPAVRDRLSAAARFFVEVQSPTEPWDYGDSDSAFVVPLFGSQPVPEWRSWLAAGECGESLEYWLGTPPFPAGAGAARTVQAGSWSLYPDSGIAIERTGPWLLRWDVSPLGYLATAAHGHLDALHLSIWLDGVALIVDPGTGAYYGDKPLRAWLASRAAHNGPCPPGPEKPRRLGPFLWGGHHPVPKLTGDGAAGVGTLALPGLTLRRRVAPLTGTRGWGVDDRVVDAEGGSPGFTVRWQLAPGSSVTRRSDREFVVQRSRACLVIQVSDDWSAVELVPPSPDPNAGNVTSIGRSFEGLVSPAFRRVCGAPALKLTAGPSERETRVYRTTFTMAHS